MSDDRVRKGLLANLGLRLRLGLPLPKRSDDPEGVTKHPRGDSNYSGTFPLYEVLIWDPVKAVMGYLHDK